jgi:hypothetical protein
MMNAVNRFQNSGELVAAIRAIHISFAGCKHIITQNLLNSFVR